jgi:hypothetical protein
MSRMGTHRWNAKRDLSEPREFPPPYRQFRSSFEVPKLASTKC